MSPFEFVTVLISIILGLGITQLMSGIADLIYQWDRVKLYWPHMLWVILTFILHVQEWWLTYELRMIDTWRLPFFLFEILYPINLFILARILFPPADSGVIDLKSFYFNNYRKFFVIIMILSILSMLENIFIHGYGSEGWLVNMAVFFILLAVTGRENRNEWVHKLLAIAMALFMLGGIVINVNNWLVR